MNYKITCHLMPWELDYALLSFIQLKKSKYHINTDDNVYIDVTLNLSDYIINWEESKISKEFFIDKFKNLQPLLKDYICKFKIYEGDKIYGGLNTMTESIENKMDYYIILNPDMYFSENLISYLIESSKYISNEYFIITPQVSKLWDSTWDVMTHPNWNNIPYENWNDLDVFDVRNFNKNLNDDVILTPNNSHKWAGWLDLSNNKTFENFYAPLKEWEGYGPCDWFSMMLSQYAKKHKVDFQHYILKNQLVCEYEIGPLKNQNLSKHYKNIIKLNNIPNQRQQFESKMDGYLQKGIQQLKEKNII